MKNWFTLQPDEYRLMRKHYTPGRNGARIDKIVVHHNAANLTSYTIWQVWQTRTASAHYQVDQNGRISQHVLDKDTAWAVGGGQNTRSISIEHANRELAPKWTVWDRTLEEGAHLVAALCLYYKLGRPAWGKNVFPHGQFMVTACPGALGTAQNALYMKRAQYWYDQMSRKTVAKPAVTVARAQDKITASKQTKQDAQIVKLTVDGHGGPLTVRRLQQVLGTTVDGVISGQYAGDKPASWGFNAIQYAERGTGGSQAIKELQKRLGVKQDGYLGTNTVKAWQKRLGVKQDGYFGRDSMRALQRALNNGKVW